MLVPCKDESRDKSHLTTNTPVNTPSSSIFLSLDCKELTQKDIISAQLPIPVAANKEIDEDV